MMVLFVDKNINMLFITYSMLLILFSDQVNAIKETSLARVLCDNSDNIQLMQPLAFKTTSEM